VKPLLKMKQVGCILGPAANYHLAYDLALTEMNKLKVEQQCCYGGAVCRVCAGTAQKCVTLPFLGRTCMVMLPDGLFSFQEGDPEVPLWARIVLLHYLTRASGTPREDVFITFRQIPGGDTYFNNFSKRSLQRLVRNFAGKADLLLSAAKMMGGTAVAYGDLAVQLPVLPRVPLTLILWEAVEGFPASVNILFDASVPQYLPTEDIVVLCQELTGMLINMSRGGAGS
jgi:hypothetical protein